jgi:hypothetical protein
MDHGKAASGDLLPRKDARISRPRTVKDKRGGEVKGCLGIRDWISHQGSPGDDNGCWGCVFSGELKLTVPNGTFTGEVQDTKRDEKAPKFKWMLNDNIEQCKDYEKGMVSMHATPVY